MVKPTYFVAGESGQWQVEATHAIAGNGLDVAPRLSVMDTNQVILPAHAAWVLRGTAGSARYTNRVELDRLGERQPPLGRAKACLAVLIPIRKSDLWWSLAQDERRAIIQERSAHFQIGMDYLPAVARRLYHSRDLDEPFDFLTWFEFAEESAPQFDAMLLRLRATEEWRYVEREVEIRLRIWQHR
ncbi:chlorite dismutase family protein [Rhizobium sullae]|uniref:Chlorite dismutase n=1 Tax=Rhizobium sullae TaxID=50338 RepID=A0A4R3Q089_RHISU|nr:chlorite dismutase family protein [Rhizobium sullae]TCU13999.1 chlorite dismutase [Rhizobium sullae]